MSELVIIKNAVIESAEIDIERGLSAWLHLDYGDMGQGFGGYLLYVPKDWKSHANQKNYAGHFIHRCIAIAGVEKWSELKGRTIRVKGEHVLGSNKIEAIGHIVKDDWFNPSEDFKKMKEELKS